MAETTERPDRPERPERHGSGPSRDRDREPRKRRFQIRRKVCRFCVDKTPFIDIRTGDARVFITERADPS
jgi:hypothetical protein